MCDEIVEVLTQRRFLQNLKMITGSRANIIWNQENGTRMAEWMQERVACWTDQAKLDDATTTLPGGKPQAFDTYKIVHAEPAAGNPDTIIMTVAFTLAGVFCVFVVVVVFVVRRMRRKRKLLADADLQLPSDR